MDLGYWGFSHWPFQRHHAQTGVDVGAVYQEAQARLMFLIDDHRRCGLLTGEPGTGKSRLFRQIARYAQRRGNFCVQIDMTGLDADGLIWHVAEQLLTDCNEQSSAHLCWSLVQKSLASLAITKRPVVVLLEHLDPTSKDCLMAIRRLMNLADAQRVKMTVLLTSRSKEAASEIWDEIDLQVELEPWNSAETAHFIEQSLIASGSTCHVFSEEALASIHEVTQGNPGEVIRICDLVLLAAMGENRHQIDCAMVTDAVIELVPSRPHDFHSIRR